jgi:hypothetical protein
MRDSGNAPRRRSGWNRCLCALRLLSSGVPNVPDARRRERQPARTPGAHALPRRGKPARHERRRADAHRSLPGLPRVRDCLSFRGTVRPAAHTASCSRRRAPPSRTSGRIPSSRARSSSHSHGRCSCDSRCSVAALRARFAYPDSSRSSRGGSASPWQCSSRRADLFEGGRTLRPWRPPAAPPRFSPDA